MLGRWRIALRQAAEAAQSGLLDEALRLTLDPDVSDHRQAVRMRGELIPKLIERADRRAAADDIPGAARDLDLAESAGAAPDALADIRLRIGGRVESELRPILEAGDPHRVLDRIQRLARHKITSPNLRRMREAAEAWTGAVAQTRKGEFAAAEELLERAARLGGVEIEPALDRARRDLETRRAALQPRVDRLYDALARGKAAETLSAAESILEIAPDHLVAREHQARAWRRVAAAEPGADPGRVSPLDQPYRPAARPELRRAPAAPAESNGAGIVWIDPEPVSHPVPLLQGWFGARAARHPKGGGGRPWSLADDDQARARGRGGERSILWLDHVGGFLLCLNPVVTLGRSGGGTLGADSGPGAPDLPVLADLELRHAAIERQGEAHVLTAIGPTRVNGRRVQTAALRDGDVVGLGRDLEIEFRQPSPISASATLRILSHHRLPQALAGVVLMADHCLVGAAPQCHVPCPGLNDPIVLYRRDGSFWCRASEDFQVDGRPASRRSPLSPRSRVQGRNFSYTLEPLPVSKHGGWA